MHISQPQMLAVTPRLSRRTRGAQSVAVSGKGEARYGAIGSTEDGRVLVVVFTRRRGMIRVIGARDAPRPERRRYGRR
jgi:uncharacterized DUF497 family protein